MLRSWASLAVLVWVHSVTPWLASRCDASAIDGACDAPAPPLDQSQGNAELVRKAARIAIVGGGVSGVSAAETLVKHGLTNVVVFEAGTTIVPIQHAVRTTHAVYDMDLIYVPALSWSGSGLEERYEAVLREYQQELVPRFFHLFAPFFRRHQYSGIQACLRSGIAWHNETFAEWAQRHGFDEVLFEGAAHILGLYGNFPVGSSPACQLLMLLANKMPSILGPSLVLASRQRDFEVWKRESPLGPLHDTMLLWFAEIAIDMPSFMRCFRHGYGSFFTSVALRNRIDNRINARVARLEPFQDATMGRQRVHVHLHGAASAAGAGGDAPPIAIEGGLGGGGDDNVFDVVIVTARPDQVHDVLPDGHPMKPVYEVVKEHAVNVAHSHGIYGVAVLSFTVSPRAGFVAQPRFVLDHQKHSRPMYSGHLSATVNVMRIIKTTDEAILTVVFQTKYHAVATEEERELLVDELGLYGFRDLHGLKMTHYPNTPTRVPVDAISAGWYDKAEAAQGHQQLYFVGETFSGHGVPTVFMHTRDWCMHTFNLPRDLCMPRAGNENTSSTTTTDLFSVASASVLMTDDSAAGGTQIEPFQPLKINVPSRLAEMGTQTYMAMLRRPLEAIRLGIHPVLLVESPLDTAMPPVAFLFCLVGTMSLLHLFECSAITRHLEPAKKKNVAIYCTEIIVSCVGLAAIVDGCTDLLFGRTPADFLLSTRRALFAGMVVNGMYLCELEFHHSLRMSLKVHHVACVAVFTLMHFCFAKHKALVVLQMGIFNVMNALTEQTVFVFILMHRVAPHVLRRCPSAGFALTIWYGATRALFGALVLRVWYRFATDATLAAARREFYGSLVLVTYPLLTLVQMAAQCDCFVVQLGLSRKYARAAQEAAATADGNVTGGSCERSPGAHDRSVDHPDMREQVLDLTQSGRSRGASTLRKRQ
ncbi:hypothetical protein CBR_g8351 [Chara braunii]|uniref:Amine oxidase domain-containing protein n=1 Tax=Chara braunii TaxID=69332 RepID=A0A388KLY2_CHABU|nr:hypothetical protein CBR_g8351 [Chara braunii]|eukprot:GBG71052.1 hypothetical protein CBR_g8351 [Chara braunii]